MTGSVDTTFAMQEPTAYYSKTTRQGGNTAIIQLVLSVFGADAGSQETSDAELAAQL